MATTYPNTRTEERFIVQDRPEREWRFFEDAHTLELAKEIAEYWVKPAHGGNGPFRIVKETKVVTQEIVEEIA